jgi:hypothetical protein
VLMIKLRKTFLTMFCEVLCALWSGSVAALEQAEVDMTYTSTGLSGEGPNTNSSSVLFCRPNREGVSADMSSRARSTNCMIAMLASF